MRGPISHPLDKLINDDRLIMLEALIPFADQKMKAPLALYIKITELRIIMNALSNRDYTDKCGLNMDMNNQEQVLNALSGCGFTDIAAKFEGIKAAINMANIMNMMNNSENDEDKAQENTYENSHDNSYENSYESTHDDMYGNVSGNEDMMDNIMKLLEEYDELHSTRQQ